MNIVKTILIITLIFTSITLPNHHLELNSHVLTNTTFSLESSAISPLSIQEKHVLGLLLFLSFLACIYTMYQLSPQVLLFLHSTFVISKRKYNLYPVLFQSRYVDKTPLFKN